MNSQQSPHQLRTSTDVTLGTPNGTCPPRAPTRAVTPSRTDSVRHNSLSSIDDSNDDNDTISDATNPLTASVTRRISLVCMLMIVSIISVTFAVRAWLRYEQELFLLEWREYSCIVRSKTISESPSARGQFRAEFKVKVQGLPSNVEQIEIAFYGRSDEYSWSKEEARKRMNEIDVVGNRCWVKRSNLSRVSVNMVSLNDEEAGTLQRRLGVAWGLTFLAAIVSLLWVGLGSHWLHRPLGGAIVMERIGAVRRGGDGGMKDGDKGLTKMQTRYVCELMGCVLKAKDGNLRGWTCSVCLEEVEDGDGIVRTVVLGCAHRFHRGCIKRWLQRGRAACPLCHWDVKLLFDASGTPKASMEENSVTREREEEESVERARVAQV